MKSEDRLQAECWKWAVNEFGLYGFLFHVPNQVGTRSAVEAMKLKAMGVTPGVPDLVLVWPELVGFEMKTKIGVTNQAQKKLHPMWEAKGITIHVINCEETWKQIVSEIMAKHGVSKRL